MTKYIIRRLLWLIPVIIGVLAIVFILSAITPGDPVDALLSQEATLEERQELREKLGLNKPAYIQFFNYVAKVVTKADLGTSYQTKQPVAQEMLTRIPVTLKLTFASVIVALIIAIPLGVISAVRPYSWIDNLSMGVALFGVSIPQFWFALMGLLVFAVTLHWLPASGIKTFAGWVLPVAMIGVGNAGNFARVTRSSMLEVVKQDYIRTARAKGQKEYIVVLRHGLRNALIPVAANVGNTIGVSLGGAIIAETIFSLPGVGKYMIDAIYNRNWPAIQGGVIMLALAFSIVMLLMDILYMFIDPRLMSMTRPQARKKKSRIVSGGV
ncbi:MAG: ABC transporter permease [Clostridiales bacterium]|nr:ABC transporter permease [Clostridiales bacterium]